MECIILAGGFGTRLGSVVSDVPKCLAPVAGQPFLAYILKQLEAHFADHVILSLGYKHEMVIDFLRTKAFTFKISWVIEKEPLGTGGGIKLALAKAKNNEVFVLNGDTFFDVNLQQMKSAITDTDKAAIALKPLNKFERYGSVQMNEQNVITDFEEKQFKEQGLINGGIYLLNRRNAGLNNFEDKFSFEKDFLKPEAATGMLKGFVSDTYFIDIGIPEDYYKAQEDFK